MKIWKGELFHKRLHATFLSRLGLIRGCMNSDRSLLKNRIIHFAHHFFKLPIATWCLHCNPCFEVGYSEHLQNRIQCGCVDYRVCFIFISQYTYVSILLYGIFSYHAVFSFQLVSVPPLVWSPLSPWTCRPTAPHFPLWQINNCRASSYPLHHSPTALTELSLIVWHPRLSCNVA